MTLAVVSVTDANGADSIMSRTPKTSAGWSIPALALSTVVGLALGLSAGAAADRAVGSALGPASQFAVGITTAIFVGFALGTLSYRWLTRGKDGDTAKPGAAP
jgi:hypothetical protein